MELALVVEDNLTLAEGIAHVLKNLHYRVQLATSKEEALQFTIATPPTIAICDYKLPDGTGIEVLRAIKEKNPHTEVLMITAYGTIELAVESIKMGAFDFLQKPFSMAELQIKIEKMEQSRSQRVALTSLKEEVKYLREQIDGHYNFGEIIGQTSRMKEIYHTIRKVAKTDSTVIIYGESGTGKELVARAIHQQSKRAEKPLVKVNCGSLNENLLESELFGHEKGAFTGATRQKKGRFELADGGSIFLDEIGDISPNMQLKLLRVLQEKELERVGGEQTIPVDVRVIAATNKNLQELVRKGAFREDLYYRLHIVPIMMPPLRERKADIPLLLNHFLQKVGRELGKTEMQFSPEAIQHCMDYDWPGNVRELENVVERALVLAEDNVITPELLPFLSHSRKPGQGKQNGAIPIPPGVIPLEQALQEVEEKLIRRALRYANGNKSAAARLLGLKSNTFFYKLQKYQLL